MTPLGTWMGTAMQLRFSAKRKKHHAAYETQLLHFVPLIVSTFGVSHEDFLRLLWILTLESRGSVVINWIPITKKQFAYTNYLTNSHVTDVS